jgi:hypothetical protein
MVLTSFSGKVLKFGRLKSIAAEKKSKKGKTDHCADRKSISRFTDNDIS